MKNPASITKLSAVFVGAGFILLTIVLFHPSISTAQNQSNGGNGSNNGGNNGGQSAPKKTGGNNGGNGAKSGGGKKGGSNDLSSEDKKVGYKDICGKDDNAVKVKFNFECQGSNLPDQFANPIYDLAFSVIRFLSIGVGIVVTAAIIIAGIQYATSQGNPEVTMNAKNKIQSALIALIIYIFSFAIIQWLVPGGVFN